MREYRDIVIPIEKEEFLEQYKNKNLVYYTHNDIVLEGEKCKCYLQYRGKLIAWAYIDNLVEDGNYIRITLKNNVHKLNEKIDYPDIVGWRYYDASEHLNNLITEGFKDIVPEHNPTIDIIPPNYERSLREQYYFNLGYSKSLYESLYVLESDSNSTLPYDDIIDEFIHKVNEYCEEHNPLPGISFKWEDIAKEFGDINFEFTKIFNATFTINVEGHFSTLYLPYDMELSETKNIAKTVSFRFILYYSKEYNTYCPPDVVGAIHHEIHHCIYDIIMVSKGEKSLKDIFTDDYKIDVNKVNQLASLQNKPLPDAYYHVVYLADVLYRLFIPSEATALGPQIYGELKGMNSKRENASRDIKQTKAYKIYKTLEIRLQRYRNPNIEIPKIELITQKMQYEDDMWQPEFDWVTFAKQFFNQYYYDQERKRFKRWFLTEAEKNLRKMWRVMIRSANSYYQKQELK